MQRGAILPVRRTRHISWAPSGWLVSSTTAEMCTDLVTLTCPDDFLAVRVAFTNIHPEPYTVARVIAAPSSTLGDCVNPTGPVSWRPLTFANNGRAVDDIVARGDAPTTILVRGSPAEPSAGTPPIPAWTWTDWTPLPSVRRVDAPNAPPVLTLRALLPRDCRHTNPNGGFMEFRDSAAINRGAGYVAGHVPADIVTAPAVVDAAGACLGVANPVVSCVQFLTRNEGVVGMTTGDSHHQGTGTTTQFWNYLLRSTLELNARYAGRVPFGYWSTAQGGSRSEWFFPCLGNVLAVARPGFVVLPGWSYNDTSGPVAADRAANEAFLARLLMMAETCARAGAVPIFLTPFPRDPAAMDHATTEAWRALRDSIRALEAGGAIVVDAAAILARRSGETMEATYAPTFTNDTVHPNDAGHAALASVLTPIIERVCQLG